MCGPAKPASRAEVQAAGEVVACPSRPARESGLWRGCIRRDRRSAAGLDACGLRGQLPKSSFRPTRPSQPLQQRPHGGGPIQQAVPVFGDDTDVVIFGMASMFRNPASLRCRAASLGSAYPAITRTRCAPQSAATSIQSVIIASAFLRSVGSGWVMSPSSISSV